ncbi:MAG: hypothetical protein KJ804_19740 [Proteobacteria bacterium]|nr:hypothetical protein [Pseudomonadota bacterium]MBU1060541.1 hypothetical protein [Pseudomonadota bacterium]
MFKSTDCQSSQEIIILDPYWNEETVGQLRTKGRENSLACPVCKQPVHVRAGEKNRWHFAHKDLSNCPLKYESPNILQARSILYKWLKSKHGDSVTIEKHFPGSDLPRPLDCYVEISETQKFGYWILEKGVRSRFPIEMALSELNIANTWVFLSTMLKVDQERTDSAHLSPTEREFTYSSEYNQIYSSSDQALNYLNIENNLVTTLRGLYCIHSPQQFRFCEQLIDELPNMLVSPKTGELVHPGEHEKLLELQENDRLEQQREEELKIRLQEQAREQQQARQLEWECERERLLTQKEQVKIKTKFSVPDVQKEQQRDAIKQPVTSGLEPHYLCSVCGISTVTWTMLDTGKNTCICSRECLRTLQGRG